MKAVVIRSFDGIEASKLEDVETPAPGEADVLVRTEAIDVNYPDILFFEGKYQNLPPLPFTPGFSAVGRIEALGKGVTGFAKGQRVLALPGSGTYAECFLAPASMCLPVPEGVDPDEAAALGLVYQSAWFALVERGGFQPGNSVAVTGATGGIGMASIQLAKALGASTVIAITRGEEGCALAKAMGADHAIDVSQGSPRDILGKAIPELTGGKGVDVVIDPAGGETTVAAMRTLAWCGCLVVVGFASGDIPQLPAGYLLVKNASAAGLQWTDYQTRRPEQVAQVQDDLFRLLREGAIRPVISARLPLADYATGLGLLQKARARGRVILEP